MSKEMKKKYCQSCGTQIPLAASICPNCHQWTVSPILADTAPTDQPVSVSWTQKMGQGGLLALLGYALMGFSAFLPWATISTIFGQIQLTGLQVAHGYPGIILLAFALVGALTTLVPKKTSWTGFGDFVVGIVVLLEVGYDMSNIAMIAEETTTSYVRSDLGSGGYVAIVAGFLVIVAGLATVVKVRSTRQIVKATSGHAKSTGLRGSFPLDEQTINEQVDSGSPGVYALGRKGDKTFYVRFVGRSDIDVNAKLKEYIGKYDRFKFDTSEFPSNAFSKECQLYHTFGGPEGKLDNKNHPDPEGMAWSCPMCSVLNSQISSTKPQSAAPTGKRFCSECGMELPMDIRFCTRCGKAAA